jgi:hypothetical protein
MLVLIAATACSGGDEPETKSSAPAEVPLTAQDFDAVCSGASVSDATDYDKSAPSHKALYFESGDSGMNDHSITALPKDWTVTYTSKGADFKAIDLVACAKRTADKQVKVCDDYKSDGKATKNKVRWHTATYELSVHAASTGKELAKKTYEATDTACPMFESFSSDGETKDDYASVPKDVVVDLLKPFVQP